MLKMNMRTKNEAVKNRTEYVERKVRMLEETEKTTKLRRIEECEDKVVGLLMASKMNERLHVAESLRKAEKPENRKKRPRRPKFVGTSESS